MEIKTFKVITSDSLESELVDFLMDEVTPGNYISWIIAKDTKIKLSPNMYRAINRRLIELGGEVGEEILIKLV